MILKNSMFGFALTPTKFKWINERPSPPKGYIEYNSKRANCQSGKCPNCGTEKPGTSGGCGAFQDREIQNLMRALKRLNERDHPTWTPFYELFSIDLDPEQPQYSTMLKCHPSRYGTGKFSCCDAQIWHDFFCDEGKSWKYYYKPTAKKNNTLQKWF